MYEKVLYILDYRSNSAQNIVIPNPSQNFYGHLLIIAKLQISPTPRYSSITSWSHISNRQTVGVALQHLKTRLQHGIIKSARGLTYSSSSTRYHFPIDKNGGDLIAKLLSLIHI